MNKKFYYYEGYFTALNDICELIIINEAFENDHEKIRQVKLKSLENQIKNLAIKYKNNPKIHNTILKINEWINDNFLTVSISTLAAMATLLDASLDNAEVLFKISAILSLPNSIKYISNKLITYANKDDFNDK